MLDHGAWSKIFRCCTRGLAPLVALIFAASVTTNAWAQYHRASYIGSPLFDTPKEACDDSFAHSYPSYSDYVFTDARPRIASTTQQITGFQCDYEGTRLPPLLHGLTTIDCPSGYERINAAPWCRPLTPPPIYSPGGPQCGAGNPIDIIFGEKTQHELDFQTQDGRLFFSRTYSSENRQTSRLGQGWLTSFDRIFRRGGLVTFITLGDGRVAQFYLTGGVWRPARPQPASGNWNGDWIASASNHRRDVSWTLVQSGSTFTFTDVDGTVETYVSDRISTVQFVGGATWTYAYNAQGQNESVTDDLGREVEFTYQGNGLLDTVTAPDGSVYGFEYDVSAYLGGTPPADFAGPWARLTSVIFPDGTPSPSDNPHVDYLYEDADLPNALTGVVDERGIRTRTWSYDDSNSRATQSTGAGGLDSYGLAYNLSTSTTTVTNPFGHTTTYTSPVASSTMLLRRYTQIAVAAGTNIAAATTSFQYDSNGFISRITDAEGRITTFVRNARGLETSRTEAFGTALARTITTTWHATLPLTTQIVEPGRTTNADYDADGNLIELELVDTTTQTVPYSTNGQVRTWTYTYTAAGLLDTVDGPLPGGGDTIDYDYDADGFLASITDQLGHVTLISSVDGNGRPLSIVDPNGVVTSISYTPRGWIETVTVNPGPDQRQTAFDYDHAGNVTEITLPSGGTLAYEYDDNERLIEVSNNYGERMELGYNSAGQIVEREIFANGGGLTATLSFVYDDIGRLRQTVGAASQTETLAYDRTNNVTSIEDPRSETWSRAFDALNRLMSETDPETHDVEYGYDGIDALVSFTDGRNLQTTYVRNGFGDIIQEVSPDRGTTTYWRDAAGNVIELIDAEGVEINFTYDDASRMTTKTFPADPAQDQAFTYDDVSSGNYGKGRVTGASDAWGARSFVYDVFGQLIREARTINAHSYQTEYEHGPNGGVTLITYPSGREVRYARDLQDRITTVDTRASSGGSWNDVATDVTWRPFGPLAGLEYGNGLELALSYDQNYWLTDIDVTGGSGGATLDLAFGHDAAGAVNAITDAVNASRSATYTYTDSGRLESETRGLTEISWSYDAGGNRTRETRDVSGVVTFDDFIYPGGSNRLNEVRDHLAVTQRSFSYRDNGQLEADDRGAGGDFTYSYNMNGRLAAAELNGSPLADYGYDAAGRRITRDVVGSPGVSREYLYFPDGRLMAEADGTGAIIREYLWLEDLPLAATDISGGGTTLYYIHASHRGEPVAMTNASKVKVWDASYAPFGAANVFTATTQLDLRLPGQQLQGETGLHQNWMRDYDPSLGRYAQPDPIGLAGGPNIYSYSSSDPLNFVDFDAEDAWLVSRRIMNGLAEHMFVVVAPELGAEPEERFSYGPGSFPFPLSPRTRSGDDTDQDDAEAWRLLACGPVEGVAFVRINAPDPIVVEEGHRMNALLRRNGMGYSPTPFSTPFGTANSNSAAYAVAQNSVNRATPLKHPRPRQPLPNGGAPLGPVGYGEFGRLP